MKPVYIRSAWIAFAIPALLGAADLTIDHVTAAGPNLKKMQADLAAAGIRSEYGGPHSNRATEMAITSFPDGSYLELIAPQPNADPKALAAHYWYSKMKTGAGPAAWAVRSSDAAPEVKRLQSAGIVTGTLTRSGRTRPDGTKLDWETATVGPEPNGVFFPFLIRDFTPRERRAFPSGKPTTTDFAGIAKVVIAVRDLNTAIARYRKAQGWAEPLRQADSEFGAQLAAFPGTPVVLASPLSGGASWLGERLNTVGEGPCAFILSSRVTSAYKAVSKSRWFGNEVSWLNGSTIGWRLGFE